MPTARTVGGFDPEGALVLLAILACVLLPMLLARRPAQRGASPEDEGGDGGLGVPPSPRPPAPGRGGIPLPDAEQSRRRVRDHGASLRARVRRSRTLPTHAPAAPARRSAR